MLRLLLVALLLVSCSATFAEDAPPAKPEVKPPAETLKPVEVTSRPAKEDFLILPLRVYRLRAKEFPAAHTKLEEADVERIVKKVNRVWSFAGIAFGLESIREADANVAGFKQQRARAEEFAARLAELERKKEKPAEKKEEKPQEKMPEKDAPDDKEKEAAAEKAFLAERRSRIFQPLIPPDTRTFDGFRVYYIQEFDVNGIYYGRREAIVKATAALRQVPGGIDEPLPRVTSHELGHGLGLPHRQDRTNLMQSGTTGTTLSEDEVKSTRGIAEKVPGLLRYRDLAGLIEKETDPARKALLEKWKATVEEAVK